jgi:serine/threonine protein kinase
MEILGKTLGNYRIDHLLGEGGMGAVYHAYDISLQREVAIKLVHPHLARQPDFRQRFIHEARIMAHLDHPGIVRVYHLGVEKDLLYLPMEFIKGGNLRQLLDRLSAEKKWIPLNEAILLVQQLSQTVEYAHRQGVLHRDIKPANLMLKPEPTDGLPFRVILTDLGLAKLVEGLGLTQEGTSVGTPAYMSPEQALGQPTDPRSDVYSLGILLFELAARRLPFLIRTLSEATRYHTQMQPPAPRSINPEIPEALERVILKALEKDPGKRYPSAAALATVLAGSLGFSTEISPSPGQDGTSLVTEYQKSVIEPPKASSPGPMTMLENASIASRGQSIFAGQSVAPGPETRIQILHRERTAKMLPLPAGTVTIGREPGNHIVLDDQKASRKHAQITWDGIDYHVMDLNSRNGTFLDNSRLLPGVSEVWGPDQILRIGDSWLRLIRAGSKDPSIVPPMSKVGSTSVYTSSSAGIVGVSVNPKQMEVEPGGRVTVKILLLNQSSQVDHFTFSITDIPNAWITSLPSGIQLMPTEQQETELTLTVPRVPQSRAGAYTPVLRVSSLNDPTRFVDKKLALTVKPYSQFKAELLSQRLRPEQQGQVTISNQGNLTETFTVQLLDGMEELLFEPSNPQLSVGAGETAHVSFRARTRQPQFFGAQQSHPFTTKVSPSNGEPQTMHAEMISRALFPMWLPAVVSLFCLSLVGAVALYLGARDPGDNSPPGLPAPITITDTPTLTPTASPTPTFTPSPTATILADINTTITLNPISNPVTAGQTGVTISGQVSASPAVPNGQTVQLQIRSGGCGSDSFSTISTATTDSNGNFSASFTAPPTTGTYGVQVNFPQTQTINGASWRQSNSTCQSITINPVVQDQTITVTTHAPAVAADGMVFSVIAESSSGLPVSISASGSCTGGGNNHGTIEITSDSGTCTIRYSQAGDANYRPAAEKTEVVTATNPLTQLRNAQYRIGTNSPAEMVQLVNGTYQRAAPGDADFMLITVNNLIDTGDLNDDGVGEVVGLVSEDYGGTGQFVHLVVYEQSGEGLTYKTSFFVDDRAILNDLFIQGNDILLDAIIHGPDDPGCCPTMRKTFRLRYINGQLTE